MQLLVHLLYARQKPDKVLNADESVVKGQVPVFEPNFEK